MIECIVIPIKDLSENDHDLFKPSPFMKKRFVQMVTEGFFTDPLVARRIKTFGPTKKFKLCDANYKLRELKKLGYTEVTILAHSVMTEDEASLLSLHIAEKFEITKKNKLEVSMSEVRKNYSDEELQKRLGIEELIPMSEKFDIPTYELSPEEIDGMELNKKININIDFDGMIACPNCGHRH